MANGRVYEGPEMAVVLQNEGISAEAIEALLASTSPTDFHGSRSMLNFEDVGGSPPERFFRQVDMDEVGNDDIDVHQPEKKRRLTSNQVQFLEKSFEVENKLEPERKIQLARDLGLQPRQVAIWFQNRRARWKTKQLEKDYVALKTNYDHLNDDHDNLIKEMEKLKAEVQVLKDKLIQKGMDNGNIKASKLENDTPSNQKLRELDSDLAVEEKKSEMPILACKQEDICSANSIIFDPESPLCTAEGGQCLAQLEPADSSNRLQELDNSDDEEEKARRHFPKLEDDSCNFGFSVEEEHALWSTWPY